MSTARRVTSIVLGGGLLLLASAAFVARYTPIPGHLTLYAVIAAPFLAFAAPVALVVSLWGRRWLLSAAAACLTVTLLAVQLPWYVSASAAPAGVPVRTMSINMLYGKANPHALARIAAESADVVFVQEITPQAVAGLKKAGMEKTFPYQIIEARPAAAGSAIYSRHPLIERRVVGGYRLALVTAAVQFEGVTTPLRVASVHFAAPWPQAIGGWHSDFARFPKTLEEFADQAGPGAVIIGGDFNSTIDMEPFRQLLTNGYGDSAEQSGAGRQFTYPSNKRYPPIIGIDHIITRNATAVSTTTVEVPGTDHRGLLATIMVPKQPAS